jgi:hypothetical protein
MKKRTFIIGLLATLLAIFCLIAMLVCIATKAHCQTAYPYQADRPGMAFGAYNVGLHQASYEGSVNYGKYFETTTTSTTNQFRYGAFDRLELRGGFNFQYCDYADKAGVAGISNITLGAKIPVIYENDFIPAVALIGGVLLPRAGKTEFELDNYAKSLTLSVQKSLGTVTIIGNAGIMSDSHASDGCFVLNPNTVSHKAQGTYALAIYKYQGDIGVFMETYGYYGAGSSEPFGAFDLGATLALRDNVSVDISFGASYAEGFNISFCNWGVGWLIPNKHK